jgi:hypothetical protein
MANPAESEVQNLLPVQAYFNVDGSFNTFIGQNKPFYATPDPQQSGLQITNSTINSSVIGGITPAAGNFTTATVLAQPVGATDVVNLLALQSYAAGISWKQPCVAATLANITLSGLQTIDGKAVVAGDRVLVKDQSTAANNGIYIASASAWSRSEDANTWDELICAISFIEYGTQAGGAWFCTAQDGGTLGVTAVNWAQFTTSATYSAGTGLTLTGTVFSITPVGTASTYGSASTVPVFTTNASGQVSSVTNTNIAIGATQITSGTIDSARISGSYSGITGVGTLTDLTVTNNIVGSITGNAATATTATNIAGGAAGSVPYQTGAGATGFLAAGTNGQVLTLASGVPSWATPTVGTVTSVSGAGTVNGLTLTGTVTTSGSLTLGGTLDLSSPPTIGNTAPNTGRFTTLTVDDNTTLGSSNTDTVTFTARINSDFDPATDNAYDLGRTGHEWRNLFITGTANIDSLVADTADINAGTIDNTVIGATTPLAGTFTDLRFNNTLSLAGSTGTAGYVVTSNGASAPTWQALPATGLGIVDDTTTNATRYITFTSATSGNITTENVSSTKLQYNPSTGAFITANDASISGLTVGKGGGASGTNVTLGQSALANGSNTGVDIVAVGRLAFNANSSGAYGVAVGSQALYSNTTGNSNVAIGYGASYLNTTGSNNVAVGLESLRANTTASNNTAVGHQALNANTTAGNNTAVGYQAAYSNTIGSNNDAFGRQALYTNTSGDLNAAFGQNALFSNTTGTNNAAFGINSGYANTTGSYNVTFGKDALRSNTTASNNTAVGYQAGYTNVTGAGNTFIGHTAGYTSNAGASNGFNTCIGFAAGYALTTGIQNTFIGTPAVSNGAGGVITTGSYNTIIGGYNGNTGGLDIRTASNYIVLSDGAGNPRLYIDNTGRPWFTYTTNARAAFNPTGANPFGVYVTYTGAAPNNSTSNEFLYCDDTGGARFVAQSNGGLANYSGNNVNISDSREKTNVELASSYLDKVCSIPVKTFNYIDQNLEEDAGLTLGVIAQDVQAIAPELVTESNWGTEEEPKMRLSIYQTDLQYALMKAIQELNAKVEAQALEIATLKGN